MPFGRHFGPRGTVFEHKKSTEKLCVFFGVLFLPIWVSFGSLLVPLGAFWAPTACDIGAMGPIYGFVGLLGIPSGVSWAPVWAPPCAEGAEDPSGCTFGEGGFWWWSNVWAPTS